MQGTTLCHSHQQSVRGSKESKKKFPGKPSMLIKEKRNWIPQDDGKHYPYLLLEHLYNELYRHGIVSNVNVLTPACYVLIHPFLDNPSKIFRYSIIYHHENDIWNK